MQLPSSQTLPSPEGAKPRRHNAKRCRVAKRQAIIYALANHESVESIRRNYQVSRHTVLAIRKQYEHQIEAAQKRIKAAVEMHCLDAQCKALALIQRKMHACSPLELFKVVDGLTDKMLALETPVQTQNAQPLSLKLAGMKRAKRNGKLFLPSA
jgi:hypothetical protein